MLRRYVSACDEYPAYVDEHVQIFDGYAYESEMQLH